jgi:predicted MPP superfamily phosphohydrolase
MFNSLLNGGVLNGDTLFLTQYTSHYSTNDYGKLYLTGGVGTIKPPAVRVLAKKNKFNSKW